MLTAGHCAALGERAVVAFNIEMGADGDPLVTEATVIERADEPDYALLQLDQLPARTPPTPLSTLASSRLSIIQHPRGRPKVIAEGDFLDSCRRLMYYADLDTLVGSSGAGVLNMSGELIAVHTDGDCTMDGKGTNYGWTVESIVAASAYLQDGDVVGR
jgi:Trypsin-like peptidase domain